MAKTLGRRQFIRNSALSAAVAGPAIRSASGQTSVSPSDQVVLGAIGMGRQGRSNTRKFMEFPQVRVGAVCDVYAPHLQMAREIAPDADAYTDFRRVLDRSDIDAVMIGSPDHWHPLMTILACQAGKDVYVEKPSSVNVVEGRKMVEAARKYDRVVQVGTQQRSGLHFQKAVELIRGGEIGRITSVKAWNYGNEFPQGIGNPPNSSPPAELDWDLWLGPAPQVPFNSNRFGVGDRWSTFRYFWDYAGGMMTDWGVHLLDIVQWAMEADAPTAINASGGKFILQDNRDTPDTLTVTLEYPGFICSYENRACNASRFNGHGYGIEFYGTGGTLFLDRSGFEIQPETRRVGDSDVARMYTMAMERVNDSNYDHALNFLQCMQTRQLPISDIEIGHRSTSTCILSNIAYRTGRKISWDAAREEIIGDAEASRLLGSPYRAPWKLEI